MPCPNRSGIGSDPQAVCRPGMLSRYLSLLRMRLMIEFGKKACAIAPLRRSIEHRADVQPPIMKMFWWRGSNLGTRAKILRAEARPLN